MGLVDHRDLDVGVSQGGRRGDGDAEDSLVAYGRDPTQD
jgi:hypothetical protein